MKTILLIAGVKIHGVPLDHIPVLAADTGIRPGRLSGFLMRNGPDDPIGWHVGGSLVVCNDWRLRALQEREGVSTFPEPASMTITNIERGA